MNKTFFVDTYALFEMIRGNKGYESYRNAQALLTVFNLAEFNYNLKKEYTKESADELTEKYKTCVTKVLFEDILKAMDMKTKNRQLSIPGAIGYIVAQRLGIPFLTGDQAFEKVPNVIFIK